MISYSRGGDRYGGGDSCGGQEEQEAGGSGEDCEVVSVWAVRVSRWGTLLSLMHPAILMILFRESLACVLGEQKELGQGTPGSFVRWRVVLAWLEFCFSALMNALILTLSKHLACVIGLRRKKPTV